MTSTWQKLRIGGRLWMLPAAIFLLIAAGTLGPGSYFLQADTAHYHVNAADFALNACWGTGGKPGVALLLTLPYWLVGPDPIWDVVLLALAGALTVASLFSLTARVTRSLPWAMLGTLWFLSLPAILYFTRYHLGYPLAFFVFGLLLHSRKQYVWAGLAFGVTLTMHPTFGAPMVAFLGWSLALPLLRGEEVRLWEHVRLVAVALIPVIIVEAIYFLFLGEIFGWSRGILGTVGRKTSLAAGSTWIHMWHEWRISNGWLNALLLLSGLAYPAVRKPRVPLMDAIFLSGWSVVVAYTAYTGLTHALLVKHSTVGLYPLLALCTTFTLMRAFRWLRARLPGGARGVFQGISSIVVALALPVVVISHALEANVGSRTAYPVVAQVMADAAEANMPVRYFGSQDVSIFYGLTNGVRTSVNETSVDIIAQDTQAVLIFETGFSAPSAIQNDLRADSRFDPAAYEVSTYRHRVNYGPMLGVAGRVPGEGAGPARQAYVRAQDAEWSDLEVWWPRDPQGTFQSNPRVVAEAGEYVLEYRGQGCASTRRYGYGEKNFYHILLEKAGEFLSGSP